MDENIYTPPQAELVNEKNKGKMLASRWQRLWASLLDTLSIMIVTVPAMYFTGGFDVFTTGVQPSLIYSLSLGLLGVLVFFVVNGRSLVSNGQTIGKKVLGIKIVDLGGGLATMREHLLKRYAFYFVLGLIPVVGAILSTMNILFIFGKEKRCGHDHVANTKVVLNE